MRKFMLTVVSMATLMLVPSVALADPLDWVMGTAKGWITDLLWFNWATLQPAKGWMIPFSIGIFWLVVANGALRKQAHWVTYLKFWIFFGAFWLAGKIPFVSIVGKPILSGWKAVMDLSVWSFTVRELTMGVLGCAILAGYAGNSSWTTNSYYLWGFFIPVGTLGFLTLLGFIAEKIGGKTLREKLAKAPQDSFLGLWNRFRHGKTAEGKWYCKAKPNGKKCGHLNDAKAKHCGKCGTLRPEADWACSKPKCKTQNSHKALFCSTCGTPKPTTATPSAAPTPTPTTTQPNGGPQSRNVPCPHCGVQNPPGFSFCSACGQRPQSAAPTTPPTSPSPAPSSALAEPAPIQHSNAVKWMDEF